MDIRTKLVFALVSVSLASMLSLGSITYRSVGAEFRAQRVAQLDGLAGFKADAVGGIVSGWRDRIGLVGGQSELQQSLGRFNRTGSRVEADRVARILSDALAASPLFRGLRVDDLGANIVAEVGQGGASPAGAQPAPSTGARYDGVDFSDAGAPTVTFTTRLTLAGEVVGSLHAVLGVQEIATLSQNYEGLGDTGETMVVAARAGTPARVLHPVRFSPENVSGVSGRARAGLVVEGEAAVAQASGDTPGPPQARELLDYRGEAVWAVARRVPDLDWVVVVKVDAGEQAIPVDEFRADITRLAVTLAAFAILIGTILGFRFAQPIHLLAEAANRIRGGELGARSNVRQEDEVGLLARTFDQMADELEEQVGLLTEFRKFFDVSIDLMCIASTDGYFKRVNPAFVRELGWSEDDLLNRPFVDMVHPDDVQATVKEIEKLAGGSPTIRFENRFLCMDGSYKRLRWNSYPEAETGRLYAIARVQATTPEESS